jgi:ketosteroid isomerase-like protein
LDEGEIVMSGSENVEAIKAMYAAFGRGDVGAVLDIVSHDVDWATDAVSTAAPWYGPHKGKDGVGSFFEGLGKTMEIEDFTPLVYATTDDGDVLTVVRYTHRSRETGKAASMHLHHWFRFTNGKVSYCRCTEDTAATLDTLAR